MSRRSGMTLLETLLTLLVFSVIGGALALATRAGQETERAVTDESNRNRALRSAARLLTDELRSSSDAQISVTALPDGNDTLRFMVPMQDDTALGWGVHERTLGGDEAQPDRTGWSLRYTVEIAGTGKQATRRLVRQVLDASQAVQRQQVVIERLRAGTDDPPGFTVRRRGALWEITLAADARRGRDRVIHEVFHVRARNQR